MPGPDLQAPMHGLTDHPPLPMLKNAGGPVLANPEIYTVVWQGDEALGAEVDAFYGWMLKSDYWSTVQQYGVGPGTNKGVTVLTDAVLPSIDDVVFQKLTNDIVRKPGFPLNANTVVAYVLPSTTTLNAGGQSCVTFGGYHSETSDGVPYIALPRCPAMGGLDEDQVLTVVASHEAAEASTDPKPFSATGWVDPDYLSFDEIGDLCTVLTTQLANGQTNPDGGAATYAVQRLYSDAAAAGNQDPCAPAPPGPYFNVAMDPFVVNAPVGDIHVFLEAFAENGDPGTIHWQLPQFASSPIVYDPASGDAKAGDVIPVTIHSKGIAPGDYIQIINVSNDAGVTNWWLYRLSGS